jgi:glycosyltransferase involved in cell wall biosynthesis/ribosomal protein S18 acetylase RimI-like enzyme
MKIAHLTTVDLSLRYLVLPQLEAAPEYGEALGISAPGEHVPFLEARGIRHIPLTASTRGMSLLSDLKAAWQLWRILRRERVDVLHTHNPKPGVYGRIVGRLAGVPVVVNTVHGLYATPDSPVAKRAVVYGLEWLASRFSDAELVQSPEDMETLRRLRITPAGRTFLLGNGVDLSRFDPERARVARRRHREELGIGDAQVVVGMVGRLVAEKGIPELIDAAERLDDGYVVVVVGPDDPEKSDALPRDVIDRGTRAGVRFLGMRDDVDELYGAFDVFVLPSHREGFPRAAMEAAASGLPVVATDIRGCRQVVDPGANGLLFPVGDVDALVGAIEALGDDPDLRIRMGVASAARARVEFDEGLVVERVFEAYRWAAARSGLGWALSRPGGDVDIRPGRRGDEGALARLHAEMIGTGFLSSLGTGFLTVLYRALIDGEEEGVFVAERHGVVVGFVAGTTDTSDFFARFLRRRWLPAGIRLRPALARPGTLRRMLETRRHGHARHAVAPELLSLAVATSARGVGLGGRLTGALQDWARRRGIGAMRVVVGAENTVAMDLYRRSGFVEDGVVEVHPGERSWEMVWHSQP